MKYTGSGVIRDASRFDIPVYQNGKVLKKGKQQKRAGFIKGKKSIYSCNTIRIEIIEDLALVVKEFGTVELRNSIYSNVQYEIHLKRNPGIRHRLSVVLRDFIKRNVIITGRLDSLLKLIKPGVSVIIELNRYGTEISTKND